VPVQYSYTSTPPMGRTACTEPQCLYSTAIPLLPLWTVRPVQNLSACTVQLYLYSPYGSYGRTEAQCLYKVALYLTMFKVDYRRSTGAVRKVSRHFEYLENRSRDLDITRQSVREDLTVHA